MFKKTVSCLLLVCIITTMALTQGSAMAFQWDQNWQHGPLMQNGVKITQQLWSLSRFQMYPNTVPTSGQTTVIHAVWLGTMSNGNGMDWKLAQRSPINNQTYSVSKEYYTHVAIVYSYRSANSGSTTYQLDGFNIPSNQITRPGVNEVYLSNGNRIGSSGMITFSGNCVVFPIDNQAWISTIRVNTTNFTTGNQSFTVTFLWT